MVPVWPLGVWDSGVFLRLVGGSENTVWPKEGSGERRKGIEVGKVTTHKIPNSSFY